jgi:Gluconate 2-dehydrogenase subunit 3
MGMNRREFLRRSAGGTALTLAFGVGGGTLLLTPEEAWARRLPWSRLSLSEGRALEQLAETLVPGAIEAGVSHFVDHQLGVDPDDCMLIAKYFQVPPPYLGFYQSGLAAAGTLAEQTLRKSLPELDSAELDRLIAQLARPGTKVGPLDVSLFYLCLRSDAVDVVYGTPKGFERLQVPYMPHIMPPEGWNG